MKKYNHLLYLLIGVIILSCSSDDDKATFEIIVGDWVLNKYVEVYENNIERVYEYTCEPKSLYKFRADGTVEILNNSFHVADGTCVIDDNIEIESFWLKLNNSEYQYTFTNFEYNTTGDTDSISFPDENTMRLIYNTGYQYNDMYFINTYFEYTRGN